jgi:hypothetical protein
VTLGTAPCRPSVVKCTIIGEVWCAYLNFPTSRIRLRLILAFCSARQARDFGRRIIVMDLRRIRCERVKWVSVAKMESSGYLLLDFHKMQSV